MRHVMVVGVVWLAAALAMGQSLGELAKREKERREQNKRQGTKVIELTDTDIQSDRPLSPDGTSLATPSSSSPPVTEAEPAPHLPPPVASSPAPPFTLEDRQGRKVSLTQLRGRPVLLDFWATWCGPCRKTMPEVEQIHRKYRGQGLQVVGINIEGNIQKALDYWDQSGYSFMVLFDSNNWESEVVKRYQVSAIPRAFLIDRNGNVVYSGHPSSLPESLIETMLN